MQNGTLNNSDRTLKYSRRDSWVLVRPSWATALPAACDPKFWVSEETLTCGAGFLRDLLWPAGETQACCPLCRRQGPVAVEDSGSGVGGHLTSRCWQRGTRTGGISQMGPRAVLASHRRCWVQPGMAPWCLMDTTGRSDLRASSWHGPCLLTGPGLFPGVGSSYPGQKAGSWAPGTHPGAQPPSLPAPCSAQANVPPLQLRDPWPRALLAPVGSGQSCPSDPGEEGPGRPD